MAGEPIYNHFQQQWRFGGGSDVDPITQDYGTVITSPNNPTRTGYDFNGWNPAVPATMPAENMTVVAQWTKATYTVTITGSGVTADNTTPEYGANVVLTIMDDPDAELISLTVNGNNVTSSIVDHQYTITSVSGNVSVVATWILTKEFITLATSTATFSCEQDLNFTGSELKAYIAAAIARVEMVCCWYASMTCLAIQDSSLGVRLDRPIRFRTVRHSLTLSTC